MAIFRVLAMVLWIYWLILIARLILDWIQVLAREWQPRGPVLLIAEFVYTVTDPPLKFLRRLIPPLSLGGFRLDMAFLVLIVVVSLARSLL